MIHASQKIIRMLIAMAYLLRWTWSVLWHCCFATCKQKTINDQLSHPFIK